MNEPGRNRFTRYFPLLLDALRSTDPNPMRPAEARAWIRSRIEVEPDDLTRLIKAKSKQTIFENDVHWTRFYLVKAGLIGADRRGFWGLTPLGRNTHLTPDETWDLYVRVRDANRPLAGANEEDSPAPDFADGPTDDVSYWFVGALWDDGDQGSRFMADGIWENGYTEGQFSDLVRRMKAGDRISIKASFVQKRGLPFDVGGRPVSAMRIKATGTVLQNLNDGRKVKVAWDRPFKPRDWYFYTYRSTIVEADIDNDLGSRLVEFTFRGEPQDYRWFLEQPYWREKYGVRPEVAVSRPSTDAPDADEVEGSDSGQGPDYTIADIVADGSFLDVGELKNILDIWKSKKNLVLQGPPGTGKNVAREASWIRAGRVE